MMTIDSNRSGFLVVGEAEEHRKYEQGKPKEQWERRFDENGELIYRVQLAVMGNGRAQVILVSVPGDPGVKLGELVRPEELTVSVWERDGKSGVTFRARAIVPATASGRVEKAAA